AGRVRGAGPAGGSRQGQADRGGLLRRGAGSGRIDLGHVAVLPGCRRASQPWIASPRDGPRRAVRAAAPSVGRSDRGVLTARRGRGGGMGGGGDPARGPQGGGQGEHQEKASPPGAAPPPPGDGKMKGGGEFPGSRGALPAGGPGGGGWTPGVRPGSARPLTS